MKFENGYTTKETEVINPSGIHARPSSLICKKASEYDGKIYLTCLKNSELKEFSPEERYNCRSVIELMTMCVGKGSILKVHVEGEDKKAQEMCSEMARFISSNLEEVIIELEKNHAS